MRDYLEVDAYLADILRRMFLDFFGRLDLSREGQWNLLLQANKKFQYPPLTDLVAPPAKDQYLPDGTLKPERLADLLVVGAFPWGNWWLAKHPRTDPPSRAIGRDRETSDSGVGWVATMDWNPESVEPAGIGTWRTYSSPLEANEPDGIDCWPFEDPQPLAHLMYDHYRAREDRRGRNLDFRDGNPYNCRPSNLQIRRPGRARLCSECGRETPKEDSHMKKVRGTRYYFCGECLRKEWQRAGRNGP